MLNQIKIFSKLVSMYLVHLMQRLDTENSNDFFSRQRLSF